MNHILKNTILASFVLFFSFGCKNALQEEPTTFYSEDAVYSTEAGVETAINGLYYAVSSWEYYGSSIPNLVGPVSGRLFSSQAANRDVTGLNPTPTNQHIRNLWEGAYSTINAANIAIENLENTEVDLKNKETALGHAYFVRGFAYLDLVRYYGGVPLRTKPTSLEDIYLSRSTRAQTFDQVVSDLTKAKSMMPEVGSTLYNRPGRLAANALLAKAYMHFAGLDNNAVYWQNAYNEAVEVFNSGAYELLPTFAEIFTPGNENTMESIFEIQYGYTGGARTSDVIRLFTPSKSIYAPSNVNTFGRVRPNKEIFDQHVAQYPDDPRINATFLFDEYGKAAGGVQKIYPKKSNGNQGFAVIAKFFDPTFNGTTTERNYMVMRYADLLLMLAEIENEINGPDNAYQYVNTVLARARDTDGDGTSDAAEPADWSGLTQADFRSRIMKERQYELLAEGQDFTDTRRRGYQFLLDEVITPHNDNPTFDSTTDFVYPDNDRLMLLPLPATEISGNQAISAEDQNPGY